jgi:hypothetical protein
MTIKSDLSKYMATIGAKGGRAGGGRKVRGDTDYYRRIAKLAAEARKKKAASCKP